MERLELEKQLREIITNQLTPAQKAVLLSELIESAPVLELMRLIKKFKGGI